MNKEMREPLIYEISGEGKTAFSLPPLDVPEKKDLLPGVPYSLPWLAALGDPRVVALDMSRIPDIEYSALQMLIEGEARFAERGVTLWLAALNPGVLEVVRRAGLDERLGRDHMLFNARAAIERFQALQAGAGTATAPAAAESGG